MSALRRLAYRHPHLAAGLLALALLLKILVPGGFMPTMGNGRFVVAVCSAVGPSHAVIEVPGLEPKSEAEARKSCAFADLSLPSLAAVDPVQLAALLAFVLGSGLIFAISLSPSSLAHLRPPLRGPPVHA